MRFESFIAVTLYVIGVTYAEQTPVFLWGANSDVEPTLKSVSQNDFTEKLSTLLQDNMIIAFQEHGLTNKDFLCSNEETSQSCFAHLQHVNPKTFFTGVENPSEALRKAASLREFNSIDKSGKLSQPLECAVGKAVFVNFDDAPKSREATLEAHDTAIAGISRQIPCKAVYLYMAAPGTSPAPFQTRVKRAADKKDTADEGHIFREGNKLLLYYTTLKHNKEVIDIPEGGMSISNTSNSKFTVTLTATNGKKLNFDISSGSDGYYVMSNIIYDGITYLSNYINAPTKFSYYCPKLDLSASKPTESGPQLLEWKNIQFQAPFSESASDKFVFGDTWSCETYFSPAILSGLFVVTLMLIILFTGICWMMDINTMDRFDDPKGKTITINASE